MSKQQATMILMTLLLLCSTGALTAGTGEKDTANLYSNVGALALRDNVDGGVFQVCSGVLIDSEVFLTAGHCTAWVEPWREFFESGDLEFIVTFQPDFYQDASPPNINPANFIVADDFVTHPLYGLNRANSYDLSVLILPADSTTSIVPAQLPVEGFLDEVKKGGGKKGALEDRILLELAGYGAVPALTGPPRGISDGWRRYSTSPFSALLKQWLKHQQNQNAVDTENHGGSCYGDSGAPHFFPGTDIVVGIVSWGDIPCRASDFSYRVDTESARDFLGQFVDLP
jgi:hypothetical protein